MLSYGGKSFIDCLFDKLFLSHSKVCEIIPVVSIEVIEATAKSSHNILGCVVNAEKFQYFH